MTSLVLVAAMGRNRELGGNNQLLWHLPEDLSHFKTLTLGKPVLMGRKTWESLPPKFRPLPGRRNLVISRSATVDGAETVRSLDHALTLCAQEPELCVIGGAEIYALALPHAHRVALTEVDGGFPKADTFFPALPERFHMEHGPWQTSSNGLRYRFGNAST
jgi:dihydrofolate reductase